MRKTIGNVSNLKQVSYNRIIVVSDGSTDNTVSVAKSYDGQVVELRKIWKGGAMQAGLNSLRPT